MGGNGVRLDQRNVVDEEAQDAFALAAIDARVFPDSRQLLGEIEPPRDRVFSDLAMEMREGAICPVLIGSAGDINLAALNAFITINGAIIKFNGALAFGGTAVIFVSMASLASTVKRDLSGMGKFLFVGVIMLALAMFANIFLQLPALMIALSLVAIGIFSAFMLYDVNRIVTGGETNYITATLALYLDIYNVFVNLLAILGITGGSSD